MNSQKIYQAALAGLLHDVGKVEQRAKDDPWNPPEDARDSKQPVHAAWTLRVASLAPQQYQSALLAGAYHHHPEASPAREQLLSKRIALADKLSAGERSDFPKEYKSQSPPMELVSIFDRVSLGQYHPKEKHYLPLDALSLENIGRYIESDKTAIDPANARSKYDNLREEIETAVKQDFPDAEFYLENLLGVMQRFTWCVPSAYYHSVPDVSLYDHSRMTAALAVCLHKEDEQKIDALLGTVIRHFHNKPKPEDAEILGENVALLIGGDISGVQDFIYTITNKGATSALRGRSFYLQLLTEAVARFALRELGLPITNIIYAGGGNFYILARASDEENLAALRKKLSRILYRHHQGDLYVAVEGILLKANDFMRPESGVHPLSKKWGELARRLAAVKNRRFAELEEDELRAIFQPQGHGGNEEKQCQVCGREHPDTTEKDDVRKCPPCLSYEELGRDLRRAQYVGWKFLHHPKSVSAVEGNEVAGGYRDVLRDLGFEVTVAKEFKRVTAFSRVWALSDQALENAPKNGKQIISRRLLVNITPILDEPFISSDGQPFAKGDIKPFEKLALESKGIKRLGVLRADVDNLGQLFAKGLGEDATLSRIASLSFAVSFFFEGWIGRLAEKRNAEHGEKLYAIYSGGDDLFFVGAWDQVVEFVREVARDLNAYTGGHPGIHISGGVVLVPHKYPLAKAAEDAAVAEHKAKMLAWQDERGGKHRKNAFNFLGQTLPWARFGLDDCPQNHNADSFENAHALMHLLQDVISQDSGRKSVLRALLRNFKSYQDAMEARRRAGTDQNQTGEPQTVYGPWNWRMFYLLRRKVKGSNDAQIRSLADEMKTHPDTIEWLGLAARWAELLTRK